MSAAATLELTVTAKERIAREVVALTLTHTGGRRLPDWAPGAHLDLILPNGLTRQYSLCGDRWNPYHYRIGVLRERVGRGGSAYVHDTLEVGDTVSVGGPRNNFRLAPGGPYLFIAGGIGITPILPMITQADRLGCQWKLGYTGRSRTTMAFLDELAAYGEQVSVWANDEDGIADVRTWIDGCSEDTLVYCCGPAGLIEAVRGHCAQRSSGRLRVERFVADAPTTSVRDRPFDVVLSRSGRTVKVEPTQSILDALATAGVSVLSSCRQGVCGTCEIAVLSGQPDHRDSILDDAERASEDCMFVCVSRSRSAQLTLDL